MNSKKSKQLHKMAELYLQDKGTKYMNKKDFYSIPNPTVADDRLYQVYKQAVKFAKKNYTQVETMIKEKLGEEWRYKLEWEY